MFSAIVFYFTCWWVLWCLRTTRTKRITNYLHPMNAENAKHTYSSYQAHNCLYKEIKWLCDPEKSTVIAYIHSYREGESEKKVNAETKCKKFVEFSFNWNTCHHFYSAVFHYCWASLHSFLCSPMSSCFNNKKKHLPSPRCSIEIYALALLLIDCSWYEKLVLSKTRFCPSHHCYPSYYWRFSPLLLIDHAVRLCFIYHRFMSSSSMHGTSSIFLITTQNSAIDTYTERLHFFSHSFSGNYWTLDL